LLDNKILTIAKQFYEYFQYKSRGVRC